MKRFKVGDIVRLIPGQQLAAECGAIGRVERVGSVYLQIQWRQNCKWHGQINGSYYRTSFVLVKRPRTLTRSKK